MIKNIIFDIGGVITTEKGAKAFDYIDKKKQEKLDKIVYFNKGFKEVLLGNISCEEYKNILIKKNKKYEIEIREMLDKDTQNIYDPLDEKMVELLYELKQNYHIYFLSNMIDITYNYLKNLLNDFDGGAYSHIEHQKKPNEEFFLTLINRYNIDVNETIFFDDKIKNVLTARKLGMQAVEFKSINDVLILCK